MNAPTGFTLQPIIDLISVEEIMRLRAASDKLDRIKARNREGCRKRYIRTRDQRLQYAHDYYVKQCELKAAAAAADPAPPA